MYFFTEVEFLGNIKKLICRKDEDGLVWWLADGENNYEYLAWIAEGNEAQPWD